MGPLQPAARRQHAPSPPSASAISRSQPRRGARRPPRRPPPSSARARRPGDRAPRRAARRAAGSRPAQATAVGSASALQLRAQPGPGPHPTPLRGAQRDARAPPPSPPRSSLRSSGIRRCWPAAPSRSRRRPSARSRSSSRSASGSRPTRGLVELDERPRPRRAWRAAAPAPGSTSTWRIAQAVTAIRCSRSLSCSPGLRASFRYASCTRPVVFERVAARQPPQVAARQRAAARRTPAAPAGRRPRGHRPRGRAAGERPRRRPPTRTPRSPGNEGKAILVEHA